MSYIYYNNKKISSNSAKDIKYDNTDSGLSSENINDAIDELNDSISEQNKNLDGLTVIVDGNGKITGYTTNTGGADTVFPFKTGELVGSKKRYGVETSEDHVINIPLESGKYYHIVVICCARDFNYYYGWIHGFLTETDAEIISSPSYASGQEFDEVYTMSGEWILKGGTYLKATIGCLDEGRRFDVFEVVSSC